MQVAKADLESAKEKELFRKNEGSRRALLSLVKLESGGELL